MYQSNMEIWKYLQFKSANATFKEKKLTNNGISKTLVLGHFSVNVEILFVIG